MLYDVVYGPEMIEDAPAPNPHVMLAITDGDVDADGVPVFYDADDESDDEDVNGGLQLQLVD